MVQPAVSVIIPTYNRAQIVCEAIDSVLGQTFTDYEIIVVDDGSTDVTGDLLNARYGNRVRYLRQDNGGPGAARNLGIGLSRGEYVAFLDSDDSWLARKLAAQMGALEACGRDVGVCFTDARAVGKPGRTRTVFQEVGFRPSAHGSALPDALAVALLPRQPIFLPTVVVRREAVLRIGGFDAKLRVAEDTDLFFRLALATKFCCVNECLVKFDVADGLTVSQRSVVRRDPLVRICAQERMYRKLCGLFAGHDQGAAPEMRRRLGAVLFRKAMALVKCEDYDGAIAALQESLRAHRTWKGMLAYALCVGGPATLRAALAVKARLEGS